MGPTPLPGERIQRVCGDTQCRGQRGRPGLKEVIVVAQLKAVRGVGEGDRSFKRSAVKHVEYKLM